MKHFVTGGAGFIGSHLVDSLVEKNQDVTVFDNLSSGKRDFVNKGADFIKGDITNIGELTSAMKGHDHIWHLAANPDIKKGIKQTNLDLQQNTIGTYNVLEAMRKNNIKKISFASSSAVYGEADQIPTPETYGPIEPISLYAASKLAGEGLITAFSELADINYWIFRFANVIGPRLTHGVIYDFVNKLKKNPEALEILGNGRQEKSYLLVSDCVEGMLFSVSNSENDIFNLGSEDTCSVTRIGEIVAEEMKLEPKFTYTGGDRGWKGDVPKTFLDPEKMEKLGWTAQHNSEEAIKLSARSIIS